MDSSRLEIKDRISRKSHSKYCKRLSAIAGNIEKESVMIGPKGYAGVPRYAEIVCLESMAWCGGVVRPGRSRTECEAALRRFLEPGIARRGITAEEIEKCVSRMHFVFQEDN